MITAQRGSSGDERAWVTDRPVDAGSNLNRERPIPIGALGALYWVYWVFVTTRTAPFHLSLAVDLKAASSPRDPLLLNG